MANIMKVPIAKYGAGPAIGTKATDFRYVRVDNAIAAKSDTSPGTELSILFSFGASSVNNVYEWKVELPKSSITQAAIDKINEALLANASKPGSIFEIEDLISETGATCNVTADITAQAWPSQTSQP